MAKLLSSVASLLVLSAMVPVRAAGHYPGFTNVINNCNKFIFVWAVDNATSYPMLISPGGYFDYWPVTGGQPSGRSLGRPNSDDFSLKISSVSPAPDALSTNETLVIAAYSLRNGSISYNLSQTNGDFGALPYQLVPNDPGCETLSSGPAKGPFTSSTKICSSKAEFNLTFCSH